MEADLKTPALIGWKAIGHVEIINAGISNALCIVSPQQGSIDPGGFRDFGGLQRESLLAECESSVCNASSLFI